MYSPFKGLCIVLVVVLQLVVSPAQADPLSRAQAVAAALSPAHPAEMLTAAVVHFDEGAREEGAYLFYFAQLRWRRYITARPDLPPDQDRALFASMLAISGPVINEWAFGDIDWLVATLRAVMRHDAQTPDPLTPVAAFPEIHVQSRQSFAELIDLIETDADELRAGRTAAGLENR